MTHIQSDRNPVTVVYGFDIFKIPNVQDLERNYKMDNEDLNTCSGGQGEKQWLYIQDDIRYIVHPFM